MATVALAEALRVRSWGGVYDVGGRVVQRFDECIRDGGRVARWDGRDESGREVSPGVYYLRARTTHGVFVSMRVAVLS